MQHIVLNRNPDIGLESINFSKYNFATETYWDDFKQFVGFSDEARAQKRLNDLKLAIRDFKTIKSKISQSNNNSNVSVNILRAMKSIPVEGKNGTEIARSLTSLRLKYEALFKRSEHVTSKEEMDKIKQETKDLAGKRYPISDRLILCKKDILHICDELIDISELEIKIIKVGLEYKKNNISTESYIETIEAVAIESFFSKLGAIILCIVGVLLLIDAYYLLVVTFFFILAGAWGFAVALALFAIADILVAKFLFELAQKYWEWEDDEDIGKIK